MSCKDERHDHHHHRSNCVCDVVKFIDELQDCASSACPTGCDVPFLGANQGAKFANTRPFLLYTTEGELFLPYSSKKTILEYQVMISVQAPLFIA